MIRFAILGFMTLAAGAALAQQAEPTTAPPPAAITADTSIVKMEEPQRGDRWVYEVRDEITGNITTTRTNIVTEVTASDIATRFTNAGNGMESRMLFDRSWNVIEGGQWRYSPNDGLGVRMPLAVGKSWDFRGNETNVENGAGWKRSGNSKVVAEERLTTKAGSFDTFKIETTYTSQNLKDPTRKADVTVTTWYAPAIDHWVKRTFTLHANKRLMTDNVIELVEYGRKS